jgi:aquaporin NIP
VVIALIYSLGHISGAHLNPAVTIAFFFVRRFPKKEVLPYLLSQFLGAFLASFFLSLLLGHGQSMGETIPKVSTLSAFVLEALQTFFLMFTIMAVATDSRAVGEMAGLAVGAVITLNAIWAGPLTGASMNPARSLGPALISGHYDGLWIYLTAPVIGAILGAWVYNRIRCETTAPGQSAGCC